jgi:hypothetical protein
MLRLERKRVLLEDRALPSEKIQKNALKKSGRLTAGFPRIASSWRSQNNW